MEPSADELALEKLVSRALLEHPEQERSRVARAMLREGFTPHALRRAATEGTLSDVARLLDVAPLGLRPGDRMALAAEAKADVSG